MKIITETQNVQYVEFKIGSVTMHMRPLRFMYLVLIAFFMYKYFGGFALFLMFLSATDIAPKKVN